MNLLKRSIAGILSLCLVLTVMIIPYASAEEEEIPLNLVWQFEDAGDGQYYVKSVANGKYLSANKNIEVYGKEDSVPEGVKPDPAKVYFNAGMDRIGLKETLNGIEAGQKGWLYISDDGSECSWGWPRAFTFFQDNGDGTYTQTKNIVAGKNYIIAGVLTTDPETNVTTCHAMSNAVKNTNSYSARLATRQLEVKDGTIYPTKPYVDPVPDDDPEWIPGIDPLDPRALWTLTQTEQGYWIMQNEANGSYLSGSSNVEMNAETPIPLSIDPAANGFYIKAAETFGSIPPGRGLFYEPITSYPGWTFHNNKLSEFILFKVNENGHYIKTNKLESGTTYVVAMPVNDELCAALSSIPNGQAGWKSRLNPIPLDIVNNSVGKMPWDFSVKDDSLTLIPTDANCFYGGGDLVLTSRNLKGTCDLYFADKDGHKLPDTKKLASVEVWTYFKTTIDLHDKLYFPENACYIKGYIDDQEVLSCEIPENKRYSNDRYGEKRYSFGVLADTHVSDPQTNPTTAQKLTKALTHFQNYGCDFVNIVGDVTHNGANIDGNMREYNSAITPFIDTMPVYAVMGNHDSLRTGTPEEREHTLDNWKTYAGMDPYFTKVVGDDVFIYLSVENWIGYNYYSPLNDEYMNFLETELEKYADKRIFFFFHYPLNNTTTLWPNPITGVKSNRTVLNPDSEQVKWLDDLFAKHDNVIYFNGHVHWNYEMQHLDPDFNICDQNGTIATMVHVNSCGEPGVLPDGINSEPLPPEASYGNIVDVYDEYAVVRAVDFASGEFIAEAQYVIEQRGTREYIKTGDFNLTNDTLSYEYERLPFADEKNADVVVAVYDEKGSMVYCSENKTSDTVSLPQCSEVTVKIFVWENGTMKPLIENPMEKKLTADEEDYNETV